jgi:hypothetical protein
MRSHRTAPQRFGRTRARQSFAIGARVFCPQAHRIDGIAQRSIDAPAAGSAARQIGNHNPIGAGLAVDQCCVTRHLLPLFLPSRRAVIVPSESR